MKPLTWDQCRDALERYVRTYAVQGGVWCIAGDDPHLARSVHVRADGWVACWAHMRQEGASR